MKSKTGLAFSVAAIAAVIVLFTTGPMTATQQASAGFGLGGFNGGFGFHRPSIEDNYRGKYVGELVDASDVIRCKVEDNNALKPKLRVRDYSGFDSVSTLANKHCSKCSYERTREQIKPNKDLKLRVMEEKHKQDIEAIRQEMNMQFSQIMSIIQENYKMVHIATSSSLFR